MRITLIGSGNVATHIGAALKNAGHKIVQVYSPNLQHASLLAYHIGAASTDQLNDIDPETDLFIIAVKDDFIADIAGELAQYNKLIVHTSGATDLETLITITLNAGVFYPLQTFSKQKEVDFREVPLCIEGANENITLILTQLAQTISNNVSYVNSAQRRVLHLAAVFACNFPNYLYHIAQQLLAENKLDFELLRPLIKETADKIQQEPPVAMQTGPAIRGDFQTIQTHLDLLSNDAFLQSIYQLLSEGISKMAKNGKTA